MSQVFTTRRPGLQTSTAPAVHVNVSREAVPGGGSPGHPDTTPVVPAPEPVLDAEKLDVYRLALELQLLASTLVPPQHRVLHDQMERASLSVVLNIAEGAGRRSRKEKRRFYAISRGSATETAAIVDVLRARKLAPEGACSTARSIALRIVQMLTKPPRRGCAVERLHGHRVFDLVVGMGRPANEENAMRIVKVSGGKVSCPKACACCMGRPQGILEVRKEDLKRLAVAAVLASDAGGAAASLRRKGATKVPYCQACRDHIRWARMGSWFGLVLSVLVDGLFGFLAGAAVWGVCDLFAFDWYVRHPDIFAPLLMGLGTLGGVAIALSNLRWRPQGGIGRRHARAKDAVEIVRLGKDSMDLKFHNNEFAEAVIQANPGAQYSHSR